jgi:hypothetical protein
MVSYDSGSGPQTIATGQDAAYDIVSDGTYAYWTTYATNGAVSRRLVSGSGATTTFDSGSWPRGIALDGTTLYWVYGGRNETQTGSNGKLMRLDLATSGAAPVALVTSLNFPRRLIVTADAIYWINSGDYGETTGSVMKLAK